MRLLLNQTLTILETQGYSILKIVQEPLSRTPFSFYKSG